MSLLAQGAQGDAPAVEGNSALMRLPALAAGDALLPLARPLVGFEHDGFGRVWLVGLWLVVHPSLLGLKMWVETKTASRSIRLAVGESNFLRGRNTHAFRLFGF